MAKIVYSARIHRLERENILGNNHDKSLANQLSSPVSSQAGLTMIGLLACVPSRVREDSLRRLLIGQKDWMSASHWSREGEKALTSAGSKCASHLTSRTASAGARPAGGVDTVPALLYSDRHRLTRIRGEQKWCGCVLVSNTTHYPFLNKINSS